MTEAEWLASECPEQMIEYAGAKATRRKRLLFAIACSQRVERNLECDVARLLQVAQDVADNLTAEYVGRLRELIATGWNEVGNREEDFEVGLTIGAMEGALCAFDFAVPEAAGRHWRTLALLATVFARSTHPTVPEIRIFFADDNLPDDPNLRATFLRERRRQVDLVRDLFGNPFRLVTFYRDWRTDAALTLASQMYESREFSAMPILADALQDAGCDSADVLDHCRGPGPHVRGCWVVDLVLEKR